MIRLTTAMKEPWLADALHRKKMVPCSGTHLAAKPTEPIMLRYDNFVTRFKSHQALLFQIKSSAIAAEEASLQHRTLDVQGKCSCFKV